MGAEFSEDQDRDKTRPGGRPVRQMSLDERKAFRRVMLEQVIRESLQELAVPAGAYRFQTKHLDERHHCFIAMIDVSSSFQATFMGRPQTVYDVEALLRKNAFDRFSLILDGVYWRVHSAATFAGQASPATERAAASDQVPQSPYTSAQRRVPQQLVSDEEKAALMEAIRQGNELPVVHVGDWEYQTDMAPLDGTGSQREP